jgi:hypothetical protein
MLTRRLAGVVCSFCCLLLAAGAVHAQNVRATVRIQATAVNVSGALVWQVNMQFTAADIVIGASTIDSSLTTPCPQISVALRDRILKELGLITKEEKDSLNTSTPVRFYIDSFAPAYSLPDALTARAFFSRLDQQLSRSVNRDPALGLTATPPVGFSAPTRAGETLAGRNQTQWSVELNPMGFAVIGYQVWLQTKKAAANDANNGPTVPVTKTLGDVASDLGIKTLTASEKSVAVNLLYAPEDLSKPDGTTRTAGKLVRVLEGAAYRTFLVLRDAKMQPCGFRDVDIDDLVKSNVETVFNAYGADLNVGSMLSHDNQEIFGVSGLQLVESVKISVNPEADPQGNETRTDRDQEIEDLLNKTYKPRLLAQPGQIVTNDILDKDTRQLYLVRSVSAVPKYSFADGVLTYEVRRRREIVNLTVTGAGSYSPEYGLNGSLAVSGDNLLGRSESLSLNLTGGNSFQKGQFNFSIPRETPKERRKIPIIFAGFSLSGSYSYDSDQHLGNPILTRFTNRESKISANASFEYDSFTERDYVDQAEGIADERTRLHHVITTDAGFDLQNNQLKSDGLIPVVPLDGRIVYPSLKVNYLATYDLRRAGKRGGVGEIDFQLIAQGEKGFSGLGGDFSYRQYDLSAGVQMFFGFAAPTDLFLRYQRGAGATSSETPLHKLFRLGGPLNVRGLEEGEFVGNSYAYDRAEFGIAFLPLVRTVRNLFPHGKKTVNANPELPAATNFGGIDLANTYVKIFYDRGRVFDTKSLGEILNPAHGVKGYGIAAEMRGIAFIMNKRANLTIGYARSPDSLLHRRGVVVTGLSLDF